MIFHVARGESSGGPTGRNLHHVGDGDLWRPIKHRQRRFNTVEELTVVADYADGDTAYRLASQYGSHWATTSCILNRTASDSRRCPNTARLSARGEQVSPIVA